MPQKTAYCMLVCKSALASNIRHSVSTHTSVYIVNFDQLFVLFVTNMHVCMHVLMYKQGTESCYAVCMCYMCEVLSHYCVVV